MRPCEWQNVSTPKVCVQNVHRVLERKLEHVDATACPLHRRHESGCGTHDPAASTKSGSRLG